MLTQIRRNEAFHLFLPWSCCDSLVQDAMIGSHFGSSVRRLGELNGTALLGVEHYHCNSVVDCQIMRDFVMPIPEGYCGDSEHT